MSVATAPAAYTFKADIYHPQCIVPAMARTEEFEGWGLAQGIEMDVEDNLNEIAEAFVFDREDETTFDSDEFPKAAFSHQLEDDTCGGCGNAI